MISDVIKGVSETKISASGIILATSGSAMTYGAFTVSYLDLILGFAGFLISIFSFYYEYAHSEEEKTKHQIVSEAIKHFIFGTFAFPAMYSFLVIHESYSFSINIFISVVVSYSIMRFIGVGITGAIEILQKFLGAK